MNHKWSATKRRLHLSPPLGNYERITLALCGVVQWLPVLQHTQFIVTIDVLYCVPGIFQPTQRHLSSKLHHFSSGKSLFNRTSRQACPSDKNAAWPTELSCYSPDCLELTSDPSTFHLIRLSVVAVQRWAENPSLHTGQFGHSSVWHCWIASDKSCTALRMTANFAYNHSLLRQMAAQKGPVSGGPFIWYVMVIHFICDGHFNYMLSLPAESVLNGMVPIALWYEYAKLPLKLVYENFYCGAFCFILTFYIYGYHMLGCVPQAVRRETFGDLLEQEVLFSNVLPSWQC